jgi:head-tail adaptor
MPIAARLRHRLAILRLTPGVEDERGVPAQTWTVLATVRGWVQPRVGKRDSVTEGGDHTQGGPVTSDHTVFLLPTDVRAADVVRFDPDDGRRYEITGLRDAGGRGRHLELDARLVKR